MNNRGEGEQFNWIFVIVSGAIILGFFIMFTFKYVELQEKRQDVDTVRFFGGKVLSASSKLQVGSGGASVDSNEQEGLRFGYNVNLGYRCSGNESTILINDGGTAWYKLDDEVVFMDKSMKVNALDLWILPWSYPFFVTNFIYLGDPKTNYYLVYDSNNKVFVENLDITSAFKIEKLNKAQLKPKSNSKIIYFLDNIPLKQELNFKNLTNLDFVYVNLKKNEASFFNSQDKEWSDPIKFYINENNKGQLFGAVFSNDAGTFSCNIQRSLKKLKSVSNIYSKRAELLGQLDRRAECHYSEISKTLNKLSSGDLNLVDAINSQNLAGAGCIWVF